MQISFADKRVRQLCENVSKASKKLGPDNTKKLHRRLSEIEAALCVSDLIAGRPHPLKGDRDGCFALDLAGGWRLVFSPDHDPVPKKNDGGIDWAAVTIVCIEYIEDYH